MHRRVVHVVGAGSLGLSLTSHLARNPSNNVTIWSRDTVAAFEMQRTRSSPRLPVGAKLPHTVSITSALPNNHPDVVFLTMPYPVLERYMTPEVEQPLRIRGDTPNHGMIKLDVNFKVKEYIESLPKHTPLVLCCRGTSRFGKLPQELLLSTENLSSSSVVLLGGPLSAIEIAQGKPTEIVAASSDMGAASRVKEVLHHSSLPFLVHTSADIVGVGYCSCLKELYGMTCSMAGANWDSKMGTSSLLARALLEMAAVVAELGGKHETVMGPAGLADLMLQCTSHHTRGY
eukprot:PhF_6_TR44488/c0_g1_i3/m.68508/K00057/gpsA; glycerol-3-phosphate dehydrogenase (NAD(P)+)